MYATEPFGEPQFYSANRAKANQLGKRGFFRTRRPRDSQPFTRQRSASVIKEDPTSAIERIYREMHAKVEATTVSRHSLTKSADR